MVPFTGSVPEGTPRPVMVTCEAPDVVHVRFTGPPEIGENGGSFTNVRIWTEPTVRVALAVTEPPALVAVSTYVVVVVGFTVLQPLASTVPIAGEMLTVFAFSTC